jgi:glycosyltransferase involved in cell wall biosynthesis
MHVLHLNRHLARKGGVETYLLSLLPRLSSRGITSTWVYQEGNGDTYHPSICVRDLGEAGFLQQGKAREAVTRVLQREHPDVVHVHNVRNVGVLQACLRYGPTVITTHDYRWVCPANSFFYKKTQEVCERTCGPGCFSTTLTKHCLTPRPHYALYFYYRAQWAIRNSSRFAEVIAPSGGAKDRLVAAGFDTEGVNVLPYFCPLEPAEEPRALPERPTITYIGRIAPNKGHQVFIRALGLLPDEVKGVMVGSISEKTRGELQQYAEEHGCGDRLTLRPWASRSEVLEILDRTSVFIFPSLWPETLGIVGLEALSRGVPVVASDLGGVSEWLMDGENGFKVSPKNPEEIRDSVSRLLEDETRLLRFGRAGIRTIHDRFMPAMHARTLTRLYERAVGREAAYAGT